jgi:thiamine pyrophosphate-dependent acetolactate synthase large subunit-like protein
MQLTGGEIVVRALADEGIRYAFGIPGTHNIELYDALAPSDRVRPVLVTDEQSASFMADAHWRASGRLACVNVDAAPPFAREVARGCAGTLAIGCRFSEVGTGSYGLTPPQPLIHVDIDATVPGRNYPTDIAIEADAGALAPKDVLYRGRGENQSAALLVAGAAAVQWEGGAAQAVRVTGPAGC